MDSLQKNESVDLLTILHNSWLSEISGAASIEVALSGGRDSVALLHLLWRLRQQYAFELSAVYVHHGLQAAADEWQVFCCQLCEQWQIPYRCAYVDVRVQGQGLEAAARLARYEVYQQTQSSVVALAHHADDQIETFFLAALRGSGTKSLAAMPVCRDLNSTVRLWRPLLTVRRAQITQYVMQWQLPFINDLSNNDNTILRNWLRNQLIPQIAERVPNYHQQIVRTIRSLQQDLMTLEHVSDLDWQMVCQEGYFDVHRWRCLDSTRRQRLLVMFAQQYDLGVARHVGVVAFSRELLRDDLTYAEWPLPKGKAIFYHQRLWPVGDQWTEQLAWLIHKTIPIQAGEDMSEVGIVWYWNKAQKGLPPQTRWQLRLNRKDDAFRMKTGRKNVQRFLQEQKIPPFLRQVWPVVVDEHDHCIAIPNFRISEHIGVEGGVVPILNQSFFSQLGTFTELR